LLNGTEQ